MTTLKPKVGRKKNYIEIWGQAFLDAKFYARPTFEAKPKLFLGGGGNFEAKIEARLTLRPGPANGARPDFIVCRLKK